MAGKDVQAARLSYEAGWEITCRSEDASVLYAYSRRRALNPQACLRKRLRVEKGRAMVMNSTEMSQLRQA